MKANKLKTVWLKRLIAAMRTGRFTDNDKRKMNNIDTCMVAELKTPSRNVGGFADIWALGDSAAGAIGRDDVAGALEKYYAITREAIKLELIEVEAN